MAGAGLHQRSVLALYIGHAGIPLILCVAIAALRRCSERISSVEQAMSLNGVGQKTALKVEQKWRFFHAGRMS